MNKQTKIILLILLLPPIGLYLMWRDKLWSLETRTIIFLILFFPLGIYLMFKNNVWTKKKRILITSGIVILMILGSMLPPSFYPNTNYRVENVYDCNECYSSWYMRVSDENTGYIISVSANDYKTQGCKVEFSYTKTKERLTLNFEGSRSVSVSCLSQFEGTYTISGGKWNNGNVTIGDSSVISLY